MTPSYVKKERKMESLKKLLKRLKHKIQMLEIKLIKKKNEKRILL